MGDSNWCLGPKFGPHTGSAIVILAQDFQMMLKDITSTFKIQDYIITELQNFLTVFGLTGQKSESKIN